MRTYFIFERAVLGFVVADVRLDPGVQRKFGIPVAQPSHPELMDAYRRCPPQDRPELIAAVLCPEPVAPGCGVFHTRREAYAS